MRTIFRSLDSVQFVLISIIWKTSLLAQRMSLWAASSCFPTTKITSDMSRSA